MSEVSEGLNNMENNIKSVREVIEEVCETMCDKYCKWGDMLKGVYMSDAELDEFTETHCNDCPLNRLN